MNLRINDKGHIYTIDINDYKALKTLGIDLRAMTLALNDQGIFVDRVENLSIVKVNNGNF